MNPEIFLPDQEREATIDTPEGRQRLRACLEGATEDFWHSELVRACDRLDQLEANAVRHHSEAAHFLAERAARKEQIRLLKKALRRLSKKETIPEGIAKDLIAYNEARCNGSGVTYEGAAYFCEECGELTTRHPHDCQP